MPKATTNPFPALVEPTRDAWPFFNHADFHCLSLILCSTHNLKRFTLRDLGDAVKDGFPSIVRHLLLPFCSADTLLQRLFCQKYEGRKWPHDVLCFLSGIKLILEYLSAGKVKYPSEWDKIPFPKLMIVRFF